MMMKMVVHPAARRCSTYCFGGTDETQRIVYVDTNRIVPIDTTLLQLTRRRRMETALTSTTLNNVECIK
jgi:hypothetical protein